MNKKLFILLLCTVALTGCSLPSWMGGTPPPIERVPGERYAVLPAAQSLEPDKEVQSVLFTLPPATQNADWQQHTGMITAATGNLAIGTLEKNDSTSIGSGEEFIRPVAPRPVVADGTIFVMDAIGTISAHDTTDIDKQRWESKGISEEDEPDVLGGGLAWYQGKLYATSGRGVVAAFDSSNGKEIWRKTLRTPFSSAPRVADGKLFAITTDSQLLALDADTGDILWSHRGMSETASLMNAVSPAVSGGDVIVPYPSGEVYSLVAADGHSLWSDALTSTKHTLASSTFSGIGGDPVVDGEVVFAVSGGGKMAVFLLATGQRAWERPISSINTPWVAGEWLFVLTADNVLSAMVKYNGTVRWSVTLPSYEDEEKKLEPILWRGPVLVDGKLAVVGSHGKMMLISASDGLSVGERDIADDVITAPVVAGGRMYLVGRDATLYSIQ